MNKVFVNKKTINPNEPVKLSEGDFVGIGANEPSQPDFYVFKLCKNIRDVTTSVSFEIHFHSFPPPSFYFTC